MKPREKKIHFAFQIYFLELLFYVNVARSQANGRLRCRINSNCNESIEEEQMAKNAGYNDCFQ